MAASYEDPVLGRCNGAAQEHVWTSIARGYAAFRSPFVPCHEDIAAFERAVNMQAGIGRIESPSAVMLGVTPGIALMRWPQGSRIVAAEISQAVIDALWPGDIPGTRQAICASWFSIPVERKSCDVVIADGSLSTCRFPEKVRGLVRAISNLLVDDGMFVFRSYVRPHVRESVEAVFDDLFSAKGLSVDCFKMRLYLAMQRSPQEGVAVREAVRILDRYNLNPQAMQDRFGWSSDAVEPFHAWRASDAIYSFPTLDELRDVLRENFVEVAVTYPRYELGHCCPILAMRSRAREGAF